jgi:hypothetical protein
VQKKLADAATDAAYGTLAAIQVGRLKDQGKATPEMISMIKRQNCDRALHHSRVLQEIFGGNAVSDEYMIGRHVANLYVTQTYEGQSDIHSKSRNLLPRPISYGRHDLIPRQALFWDEPLPGSRRLFKQAQVRSEAVEGPAVLTTGRRFCGVQPAQMNTPYAVERCQSQTSLTDRVISHVHHSSAVPPLSPL